MLLEGLLHRFGVIPRPHQHTGGTAPAWFDKSWKWPGLQSVIEVRRQTMRQRHAKGHPPVGGQLSSWKKMSCHSSDRKGRGLVLTAAGVELAALGRNRITALGDFAAT